MVKVVSRDDAKSLHRDLTSRRTNQVYRETLAGKGAL